MLTRLRPSAASPPWAPDALGGSSAPRTPKLLSSSAAAADVEEAAEPRLSAILGLSGAPWPSTIGA